MSDRLKIAAVAATAALSAMASSTIFSPPQDCRSRGDCGKKCKPIPESAHTRLKIAAVAATAATVNTALGSGPCSASRLPQSRRLRRWLPSTSGRGFRPASRLPQSRRLRPHLTVNLQLRGCPASRLPQSRRLRHSSETSSGMSMRRLKIAAVAATAATAPQPSATG